MWDIFLLDFLMWEILLLDFFNVGHSDAGLFSSWTNEQASQFFRRQKITASMKKYLQPDKKKSLLQGR
jgi:hypothetical protein